MSSMFLIILNTFSLVQHTVLLVLEQAQIIVWHAKKITSILETLIVVFKPALKLKL